MAFANEHSVRLQDPDKYDDLRTEKDKFAPGVHAVYGVTAEGTSELQSIRFSVSRWTAVDAEAWLEKHDYKVDTFEEAVSGSFGMCGTGLGFEVTSRKRTSKGIPTQKFKKELARVGEYVQDGQRVVLTHAAFDHWVAQFARMAKVGVKIPIAVGKHEAVIKTKNNRGWMTELFREGDSLFLVCKMIGEDAIEMAPRADVSLYSPGTWSDGVGNDYVRPITHVLITTSSVIPGLSDWIPLAASLSNNKEKNMDLAVLGKALGLSLDKAEKPEELVTAAFNKLQAESDIGASALVASETALITSKEEVKALKLSLADAGKPRPDPDPMLLKLSADNREMKLDGLLKAGRILPTVRDGMRKLFVGNGGAAIALSLTSGVDDQFDEIIELFAANDPVELREQTGPQTIELQNNMESDKDKNLLVENAERRAEAHSKKFARAC